MKTEAIAFLFCSLFASTLIAIERPVARHIPLGGKYIRKGGITSVAATEGSGGIAADLGGGLSMTGFPGIIVYQDGESTLKTLSAVVSALTGVGGDALTVNFSEYDWHMAIWPVNEYFAGDRPLVLASLGAAPGVNYVTGQHGWTVPDTYHSNSGLPLFEGGTANNYLLSWDLTQVRFNRIVPGIDSPLPEGEYVIGFASAHHTGDLGVSMLAYSTAAGSAASPPGAVGVWESGTFNNFQGFERGYWFGEPPADQWGWALEITETTADFNLDDTIDATDIDGLCRAFETQNPDFDLTGDGIVNEDDLDEMIGVYLDTTYGDANLDGVFNSADLIQIFQEGQYEDNQAHNSGWSTGDWNCDGEFNTGDMIRAFQEGTYSSSVEAVPEPAGLPLAVGALSLLLLRRKPSNPLRS